LDFTDISLGAVYELSPSNTASKGKILVAGLSLAPVAPNTPPAPPPANNAQKLALYLGQVVVIDKGSGLVVYRYMSPDGMYPSDVTVDANGYYTVAESSLTPQNGRVVRLDLFGNIIWTTQAGMFTQVNDVRLVKNNHLLVST